MLDFHLLQNLEINFKPFSILGDEEVDPNADLYFDIDSVYFGENDFETLIGVLGKLCVFRIRGTMNRNNSNKSSRLSVDCSRLTDKPITAFGAKVCFIMYLNCLYIFHDSYEILLHSETSCSFGEVS